MPVVRKTRPAVKNWKELETTPSPGPPRGGHSMSRELSRIDADDLTPPQSRAVAALASGATISAAAVAAGVSRPTVYAWIDKVPAFVAELNRERAEQHEAIRGEL